MGGGKGSGAGTRRYMKPRAPQEFTVALPKSLINRLEKDARTIAEAQQLRKQNALLKRQIGYAGDLFFARMNEFLQQFCNVTGYEPNTKTAQDPKLLPAKRGHPTGKIHWMQKPENRGRMLARIEAMAAARNKHKQPGSAGLKRELPNGDLEIVDSLGIRKVIPKATREKVSKAVKDRHAKNRAAKAAAAREAKKEGATA